MKAIAFAAVLSVVLLAGCTSEPRRETLDRGSFERVELSVPASPDSVVLLISGPAERALADSLSAQIVAQGAIVSRVDAQAFAHVLDATKSGCVFPSGDFDNLARFVQAYLKLSSNQPAVLIGLGAGAGLAAGALLQAPAHTFAGAIVFDFCGSTTLHTPLCPGAGLRGGSVLPTQTFTPAGSPADVLVRLRSSGTPGGCPAGTPAAYAAPAQPSSAFHAAFASLAASARARATSPPIDLADIPLVEVLQPGPDHTGAFAVFISGDGGWAGLDRELSADLAARGLPVVGLDSLRYFWSPRTPDGIAADLDRVIQHYQNAWKRKRVVLIGFSQGADVLPFVVNRLSDRTRASMASAVALSISTDATFEFHLADWVGASGDRPTLPEIQHLARSSFVCVYGMGDDDSVCPRLDARAFRVIELPGGHHFGGDVERLSTIVLDTLGPVADLRFGVLPEK